MFWTADDGLGKYVSTKIKVHSNYQQIKHLNAQK